MSKETNGTYGRNPDAIPEAFEEFHTAHVTTKEGPSFLRNNFSHEPNVA